MPPSSIHRQVVIHLKATKKRMHRHTSIQDYNSYAVFLKKFLRRKKINELVKIKGKKQTQKISRNTSYFIKI